MSTTSTTPAGKPAPKLGHVRILEIAWLKPSPENDSLYRPVNLESPDMQALVQSIRQHGVKEPLVVTEDGWILSGHRRHAAAQAAGLKTVPCRFEPIRRLANLRQSGHGDVNPEFLVASARVQSAAGEDTGGEVAGRGCFRRSRGILRQSVSPPAAGRADRYGVYGLARGAEAGTHHRGQRAVLASDPGRAGGNEKVPADQRACDPLPPAQYTSAHSRQQAGVEVQQHQGE